MPSLHGRLHDFPGASVDLTDPRIGVLLPDLVMTAAAMARHPSGWPADCGMLPCRAVGRRVSTPPRGHSNSRCPGVRLTAKNGVRTLPPCSQDRAAEERRCSSGDVEPVTRICQESVENPPRPTPQPLRDRLQQPTNPRHHRTPGPRKVPRKRPRK